MKTPLPIHLATLGPVGHFPIAPGTLGSLVTVLGVWLLGHLTVPSTLSLHLAALVLLIIGIPCATLAERHWGRKDPGAVILDEVVGQILALAWLPLKPLPLLSAFILFRVLDILKPVPIRTVEKHLPEGWGIMLDDVVGGLMTAGLLALCHRYLFPLT